MSKYPEAKISILIPNIIDKTVKEMYDELVESNKPVKLYEYSIDKINQEEEINIVLVSDCELSDEDVMEYYMQVMVYHQGIGETLTEKDMDVRDKEVKDKWLNGNFNYWILDQEA